MALLTPWFWTSTTYETIISSVLGITVLGTLLLYP
jgi:hypothetical protein